MALPPAIFLMGPTASGKTDLAVRLVKQFPCEIISVDSALVYRGMDIGTAKPDAAMLAEAPHRLIDIREPSEAYSAAEFREDALREMRQITEAGRIPLLAGGTMLYFRALQYGLADMPPADQDIRDTLTAEAEAEGWPAIHARLASIDPAAAARIKPTDPQRIQRAMEVWLLTGQTMTELHAQPAAPPLPWDVLKLVFSPADRSALHDRIQKRFRIMLEQGFLDEMQTLRQRGDLHADLPAMRAVGYRQAWAHLEGELDFEAMVEKAVVASRQLAKRQLTWLRSEAGTHWIDSLAGDAVDQAVAMVAAFLQQEGSENLH